MSQKKIRIALLLGGTSPEKEVSKSSAKSIYTALKNLGYEVILINPAYGENQPKNEDAFFIKEEFTEISNRNYVKIVNSSLFDNIDLVFLALHGKWGEDGTIQSLLELRGIKYTGSKVLSSAMSMDKDMSKILFKHYGIRTPKWFSVNGLKIEKSSIIDRIETDILFPCVVKPNDQGSTVGLTICKDKESVIPAIEFALKYSNKAVIEEFVKGREMTVAILDNKPLPVLEVKPKHSVYDYECKYTAGMSEYFVPAEIPEKVFKNLQEQALLAHNCLECEVYSRVDFMLTEDNKYFCLEVNTLPGMTSTSLVPKMAKAAGISFEELIEKIVELSL